MNNIENGIRHLKRQLSDLTADYAGKLPVYEIGYIGIGYFVKLLMDNAPRHGVALETIKVATEEGIKWHVEEHAKTPKENYGKR